MLMLKILSLMINGKELLIQLISKKFHYQLIHNRVLLNGLLQTIMMLLQLLILKPHQKTHINVLL
jgi:hypothetical protein